jgi:hypothetical protein
MAANPPKMGIPQQLVVVLAVQAGTESAERCIFCQDKSSGPSGPNAILKRLIDTGVNTFAGKNQLATA